MCGAYSPVTSAMAVGFMADSSTVGLVGGERGDEGLQDEVVNVGKFVVSKGFWSSVVARTVKT